MPGPIEDVRGCIYLVPVQHVPLALRFVEDLHRKKIDRDLEKAGTGVKALTELGAPVLATRAAKGPLTTDAPRKALPEGAVRCSPPRPRRSLRTTSATPAPSASTPTI